MLDIYTKLCYYKNVKHAIHFINNGGEKLKNNIKNLRKEKGITQDELANACNVTRQTIISIESGKYTASLQLAFKISRFFGRTVEEVFIYEEDEL